MIEGSSKDHEISVKLNGFEAQKCNFPFIYDSSSHSQCVSSDIAAYSWCSPYPEYTNQTLNCDNLFLGGSFDSCPGMPYTHQFCGHPEASSIYSMKFTTCPNSPPIISGVSVRYVSYSDMINITGSGFSALPCENEIYIGYS